MKKTMFALVAAALIAAPLVAQDTRPGIGILPFDNGSIEPNMGPLGKGIPALMITEMARNTALRVVERDQIQKILDEQKLGANGNLDPASIVKVGKLIGARYMIAGSFMTEGGKTLRIDVRCFNTETGEIVYSEKTMGTKDAIIATIQKSAEQTSTGLKLPAIPPAARGDASASAEKAKKMPLATAMLYARAIDAQDSGKTGEAKTLYRQVLAAFPDYGPAKDALNKLP